MKKYQRGFTLIELLVVIAIIGILSGIVLVSLGVARNKAKDASATASLSSSRSQAELGLANGVFLADLCTATGEGGLGNLVTAAETQLGGSGTVECKTDDDAAPTAWAVKAQLLSGDVYCVDNTGYAAATSSVTFVGLDITDQVCDN